MKLQAASKKEVARIALGTLVCDVIMIAALFLLSQFGIGKFELVRILVSALCGSLISVVNFAILCLTVQTALNIDSQKRMKRKFQTSYNIRMLIQAAWVMVCFFVPFLHLVAGAAPLLFPHVVIIYLQMKGKLLPASESDSSNEAKDDSAEDAPQD